MYTVYRYTSPSGKVYIGQTCKSLEERAGGFKGRGYKKCTAFYNAILKYGLESFSREVIAESLTKEEADIVEQDNIKKYKELGISYNICKGGQDFGHPCSEETKKKISAANKGNQYSKGRPVTERMRQRLSEVHKGKTISEEQKARISEANKNRIITEETRKKISKIHKGKKLSDTQRSDISKRNSLPIIQLMLSDEFICEWPSIKLAAENYHIASNNIVLCCKGKRKSAAGFKWRYKTE